MLSDGAVRAWLQTDFLACTSGAHFAQNLHFWTKSLVGAGSYRRFTSFLLVVQQGLGQICLAFGMQIADSDRMNDALQNLLKLQALEFDSINAQAVKAQAAELRGKIPQPVLAHYDRLRARGKKGVAVVRNQVCAGCHMLLPVGVVAQLMHDNDVQLCDTCGRYLYLPDPAAAEFIEHVAATKPVAKPRKRKALSHA